MSNANKEGAAYPADVGAAPFLGWIPRKLWRMAKDFFIYSVEFLPLAAATTGVVNTAIQSDSDFLCVAATRVITDAANVVFAPNAPMLVRIFDAGSGRAVMDRPIHMDNYFGTGQLPSYWPMPKIFRANGTIETTVQNLDAANGFNVRLAYLGFKVFDYAAS